MRPTRRRWLPAITIMTLLLGGLAIPGTLASDDPCGLSSPPINEDEILMDDTFEEAYRDSMEYSEAVINDVLGDDGMYDPGQADELLLEELLVPGVERDVYHTATSGWRGGGPDDIVEDLVDTMGGETGIDWIRDTIRFAPGSSPIFNVLIDITETSKHKDIWTAYVRVEALCGGYSLGDYHDIRKYNDRWGKVDSQVDVMEFPLKEITPEVQNIEALQVTTYIKACEYGWYSGSFKGCETFDYDTGDNKMGDQKKIAVVFDP